MRYPTVSAIFSICIGILMVGMWTFFLFAGEVQEFESRPAEILLHLTAEYLTAAGLITAGIATYKRRRWGVWLLLFSFGMLTYTLILSPGYYVQRGETAFVLMFAGIFAATAVFTLLAVKNLLASGERV
ncbi:MAG: hypothetical protein JXQ30_16045 [Spirochaetes bacterium]|nr:hypothetical protein [Spirochaetota bacterium]